VKLRGSQNYFVNNLFLNLAFHYSLLKVNVTHMCQSHRKRPIRDRNKIARFKD